MDIWNFRNYVPVGAKTMWRTDDIYEIKNVVVAKSVRFVVRLSGRSYYLTAEKQKEKTVHDLNIRHVRIYTRVYVNERNLARRKIAENTLVAVIEKLIFPSRASCSDVSSPGGWTGVTVNRVRPFFVEDVIFHVENRREKTETINYSAGYAQNCLNRNENKQKITSSKRYDA